MARSRGWLAAGCVGLVAIVPFVASTAYALEPRECVASHTTGQELRDAGRLVEAGKAFSKCSVETCPPVVRADCAALALEIERSVPTVVFAATDPRGVDVSDGLSVYVDGTKVADDRSGLAVPLDPGPRHVRLALGGVVRELTVVLREGEKNRSVAVSFRSDDDATHGSPPPPVAPLERRSSSPPVISWALGGVGVAALGVGAFFGIRGLDRRADLDACRGRCAEDDVDGVRNDYRLAEIGIGVGIALITTAAVVYLVTRAPSRSSSR